MELEIGRKRKRSRSSIDSRKPSGIKNVRERKILLSPEVDWWLSELARLSNLSRSAVVRQLIVDRAISLGDIFKIN